MLKRHFFILVFILLGFSSSAQTAAVDKFSDYNVIKDFASEWLVYDTRQQSYVPYVEHTPFNYKTASFNLNARAYSGGKLVCALQEGSSLLIEQKIVGYFEQEGIYVFDIDSLAGVFDSKKLFVTLYHPDFRIEENRAGVTINTYTIAAEQTGLSSIINIRDRESSNLNDFVVAVFIFLMGFVAALRYRYPRIFKEFLSVARAYGISSRNYRVEVSNAQKTPGGITILFIALYTLLLAFILVVLLPITDSATNTFQWLSYGNMTGLLLLWVQITAIVLILTALKYFWITSLANLFDASEIAFLHFYDFIKMGLIFYLLIGTVILIIVGRPGLVQEESFHLVAYTIVVFSFLRVLILFLKLNNISVLKGVQLFSYLCGTEVLPLIIGLNILLNS